MNYKFLFLRVYFLMAIILTSQGVMGQIIPPIQFAADDCSEARSISLGDCNVLFDIPSTFTTTGVAVAGCTPTVDAWASFTTSDAGDYVIRYTAENASQVNGDDAAIALYSGTCGALVQVGTCVDNDGIFITADDPDVLTATGLAAGTTYYIRIMNTANGGTTNVAMEGALCVTQRYNYDDNTAALAGRRLALNSCNVRFDVNGTESGFADPSTGSCASGSSGIDPTASGTYGKDAWVAFDANAGDVISIEFQPDDATKYPAILIYRDNAGVPNIDLDGSTGAIESACDNANASIVSFAKVDYTVTETNTFYIRVINMVDNDDMPGQLCLYRSNQKAYDFPSSSSPGATASNNALDNLLTIGDCNLQFNIFGTSSNNASRGPAAAASSCSSGGVFYRDVWGAFNATNGQTVTIKYNNNNNDATQQGNVILELYRDNGNDPLIAGDLISCTNNLIEGVETLTFNAPATDNYLVRVVYEVSASIPASELKGIFGTLCLINGSLVEEDLCTNSVAIGVGDCNVDFNVTNVGFLDNESRALPGCAGAPANFRDGWMNFKALSTRTNIRYQYQAGQDAVLAVYTGDCNSLTLLGCSDVVSGTGSGGTETVEIDTQIGESYFIRVINITATGDLNGVMCINKVVNRDDCNDADLQEVKVGECTVAYDLPASYTASSAALDGGCGVAATVQKDAWARFTGNGGNITVTYESTDANSNPIVEVYRGPGGTCASRTFEACSGQTCTSNGNQMEQVTINSTINGATYYIRVVNTSSLNSGIMTGFICVYNSSTVPPATVINRISNDACTATNTMNIGDCGIRINIPKSSAGATCGSTLTDFTNSNATLAGCAPTIAFTNTDVVADAWSTFTTVSAGTHSIEYSNENQDLSVANDVAIAIYGGSCGTLSLVACANDIASGVEGIEALTFTATAGTQYYVRVMNISGNSTGTYGRLCVFQGTSQASPNCLGSTSFDLNTGVSDVQFNIESTEDLDNTVTPVVSNCILSGAARKDVWARFETRAGSAIDSVITVVYDNDDGDAIRELDPDVVNVGIVIYEDNGSGCPGGLSIVACANAVGEGKEAITFNTRTDGSGNVVQTTYHIRIISTNSNDGVQGKLSIFPFVQCTLGGERVRDGHFADFDKTFTGSNTNTTNLENKQSVQVFATEYGYRPDVNGSSTRNELHPEGYYSVSHSANNTHGAFYAYGYPYTGWGPNGTYCSTGPGVGTDACPFISPTTILNDHGNDANLLIVNGRRQRGKFWCQTIYPIVPGGYYIFTAWFNSLIPTDRSNLDDPQLRITVCEGSQNTPLFGAAASSKGITLPGADALTYYNALTVGDQAAFTTIPTGAESVFHMPEYPGINGRSGGISYPELAPSTPYGAARPCNTNNIDLIVLNSDVFLPESPDQWTPMRCIYQAPPESTPGAGDGVNQINLCVENISATAVGNDFGIDFISFRECSNSTDPQVQNTLNNTNCELTGNPEVLGIPLNVRLTELNGVLRNYSVYLDWLTLTEQGVSRFEIQRGTPGGKFTKIGTVNARGYSDVPSPYSFIDENLPVGENFVFYRLRVINIDNTFGYSPIIKIKIESINKVDLTLINNPMIDGKETSLQFSSPQKGEATISIISQLGVKLKEFTVNTTLGQNRVALPVQNLQAGIYIIRLNQGTITASKKLIVSK
ncbi:MAG TPA: hypothetical protein DCS93_10185 [Microscillaceae bacterium]|nr:hypothetical protein [Microscillaceae bacterium]